MPRGTPKSPAYHRFTGLKVVREDEDAATERSVARKSTRANQCGSSCIYARPPVGSGKKGLQLLKLGLTVIFMAETGEEKVLGRDGESGWDDSNMPPDDPSAVENTVDTAFTSSESLLAAPEAEHKKGTTAGKRGRPEKVDPAIGVPTPPFRIFKSDATNPHQRIKPFLNYWNNLPTWAKENTLMYVYREHPVLLFIERDPDNKDQEFNYIDKISGAEPLQDEMDLLHRYGCGNYKLVFNAIMVGKPNRTLTTVYATNLGGGDFKSNPPTDKRISDTKNVDLVHPSNASYVAYLRGMGLLPSQLDAIRESNDMASIEVVKEQQATTNKLVDTVVKMAQDKNDKKSDNTDVLEKAMSGAMDIMAKGSEAAIKVTQEANAYASRVREEADTRRAAGVPQVTPTDPMAIALQIVNLIQGGVKAGDPEVLLLRQQLDKMRDEQVTMMREELRAMRDKPVSHSDNPFNNIEAGLTAIKKMREMTEEISGGSDKGSVAEDVADAAGAPKWLIRFAPLLQQGMTLVDGFFRMKVAQNGQPPMPNYPPQGYPQNPQGYPPPNWNGPGQQHTQPQPQQWGQPQPQVPGPQLVQAKHPLGTLDPAQFTPELGNLLLSIATPLHVHLAEKDSGTTFAEWFLGGFPDETFQQIQEFGPDMVVAALYSFPPTLAAIQQFPADQVQGFVAEFLNPQFEEGDKDEDGKTKEPQPA